MTAATRDLALTSRRMVLPDGIRPATVRVANGMITAVDPPADDGAEDVGDLLVLPGLVDSHVHVNEPGRTHWEGFESATRAAALGGVTTIVDMPLNCLPPTTDVAALTRKRQAAAASAFVDVAFWGGAVPGNDADLRPLQQAGVRGFKAFLCDSGVPEFGCVHPRDVVALMTRLAAIDSTLIVHAEDPDVCAAAAADLDGADPRRYETWLRSRPPDAEVAAVTAVIAASRATGCRVHVLHLSAAAAGHAVAAARDEGLPVTAETCPHYLTLCAEAIPDGATVFKCAPPIRGRANADALWDLLADSVISAIVSDHSPCPPTEKALGSGDMMAAWGGIASLQIGLPLLWTAAVERGHSPADLVRWMAQGPARIAGLQGKGAIRVGADADLVVVDPDARWTIDGASLAHRHPLTPHDGSDVRGRVVATYLAGGLIARDGVVLGPPAGVLR